MELLSLVVKGIEQEQKHISVKLDYKVRLAIHENRKAEKEIRKVSIIEFDEEWFRGKAVIVFDDVKHLSFIVFVRQHIQIRSIRLQIIVFHRPAN